MHDQEAPKPSVPTTTAQNHTEARLWEIAENLHRADLSDDERRKHIAEWVRLTAEKVLHDATPLAGGEQPKEKAIRKASKELGVSAATVSRAVTAETLTTEAKAKADELGIEHTEAVRAKQIAGKTQEARKPAVQHPILLQVDGANFNGLDGICMNSCS